MGAWHVLYPGLDPYFRCPFLDALHRTGKENMMPQSTHDRAAELHNLAEHAHAVTAVAHGKEDHLTAHELSTKANEQSQNAHRLSVELAAEREKSAEEPGKKSSKA
jgi:hypothetical protein